MAVVRLNGRFGNFYGDAGQVAESLLTASAIEVVVLPAVPSPDERHHQAVLAASAPYQALEVVVMGAGAYVVFGVLGEQVLYLLEQCFADQRLMPSLVLDAVVLDVSEVVAVTEQRADLLGTDRVAWLVATRRHPQASAGELGAQRFVVLLTRCEQLERHADERRAFWIGNYSVDVAALDEYSLIEVADRCPPDRAAVACLVGHLDLDVFAAQADLQPVEDVGNGLHGFAHCAVAEVFFGRDQLHAELAERYFGVASVDVVAEGTRPHVDHHAVNVAVFVDAPHHVSENRPLLDRLRRVARFHVFADDCRTDLPRLLAAKLALGVDRVAVRVKVSVRIHLPLA